MHDFEIEPAEVQQRLEEGQSLQVIDVREAYERDAGHMPGSVHVELARLADALQQGEIDGGATVVFYCRVGARSAMAAQAFRASGIDAWSMSGGLLRWESERRPLTPDDGHVAAH